MQALVVRLLARAEAAGNEEGVHRRAVGKGVVGNDGESGLRLHRAHGVGDQEGIELGIEAARHGEDAMGRREIDDLGVLEHVDAEAEPGLFGVAAVDRSSGLSLAEVMRPLMRLAQRRVLLLQLPNARFESANGLLDILGEEHLRDVLRAIDIPGLTSKTMACSGRAG